MARAPRAAAAPESSDFYVYDDDLKEVGGAKVEDGKVRLSPKTAAFFVASGTIGTAARSKKSAKMATEAIEGKTLADTAPGKANVSVRETNLNNEPPKKK